MTNVGYARVSTQDPDLAVQIAALERAAGDPIRSEKRSGSSMDVRSFNNNGFSPRRRHADGHPH
jgi:DNA invertase Pin-like site-specific DNA recombinase